MTLLLDQVEVPAHDVSAEADRVIADLQVLRRWFEVPEHWIQNTFGVTEQGQHMGRGVIRAQRYGMMVRLVGLPARTCLLGGVSLVTGDDMGVERALLSVLPAPFSDLAGYNDDRYTTHQDVLDLIDRAIQYVREHPDVAG